jgi:chemotaxis protein MotA
MDLATLIGLGLAFGGVIVGFLLEGGELHALVSVSSMVIVFGGSLGATMIGSTMKTIMNVPRLMMIAITSSHLDELSAVQIIVDLARKARQNGILALETEIANVSNLFIRRAVQLVVDGTQPEQVRQILETELDAMRTRHKAGIEFFTAMGGFCPTLGVLGTVMGLVHMLESLDEPGAMGPAIAAAFIATFYGVGSANLLFLPIAGKLKHQSAHEIAVYEMAIEGILSLQAGDNPRVVSMKMRSFVNPDIRAKLEEGAA